jgi:hypothetical protein
MVIQGNFILTSIFATVFFASATSHKSHKSFLKRNMKSLSFSAEPRFLVLLALSALLILGLVLSYYSTSTAELINQVKVVPVKLYNEDLFDWFNITFLLQMIEDRELTEILDNHNVTEDSSYHPSRKESVYDII